MLAKIPDVDGCIRLRYGRAFLGQNPGDEVSTDGLVGACNLTALGRLFAVCRQIKTVMRADRRIALPLDLGRHRLKSPIHRIADMAGAGTVGDLDQLRAFDMIAVHQ